MAIHDRPQLGDWFRCDKPKRLEVGPSRAHQLEPIGLGPGHGVFVRKDSALCEPLQRQSPNYSGGRSGLFAENIVHHVEIKARLAIRNECSLHLPIFERLRSVLVPIVPSGGKDQTDEVAGMPAEKQLVFGRRDYVVRR